jgi:type IV secretory pathway TrbL component
LSEVRATTISDAAGTGPITLTKQSAAKAWVYGASDASINGTFGVSSGVDNGTGDYSYNLANAMQSDNNSVVNMSVRSGQDRAGPATFNNTSQVLVHVYDISSHAVNDGGVNVTVFGDLA